MGNYLCGVIETLMSRLGQYRLNIGETYVMGDSPLVLLTALQSSFEADPSSSGYVTKMAPKINQAGEYTFAHDGRHIRVYSQLDVNLMFTVFLHSWNYSTNKASLKPNKKGMTYINLTYENTDDCFFHF